jgi:hypothetical protein
MALSSRSNSRHHHRLRLRPADLFCDWISSETGSPTGSLLNVIIPEPRGRAAPRTKAGLNDLAYYALRTFLESFLENFPTGSARTIVMKLLSNSETTRLISYFFEIDCPKILNSKKESDGATDRLKVVQIVRCASSRDDLQKDLQLNADLIPLLLGSTPPPLHWELPQNHKLYIMLNRISPQICVSVLRVLPSLWSVLVVLRMDSKPRKTFSKPLISTIALD